MKIRVIKLGNEWTAQGLRCLSRGLNNFLSSNRVGNRGIVHRAEVRTSSSEAARQISFLSSIITGSKSIFLFSTIVCNTQRIHTILHHAPSFLYQTFPPRLLPPALVLLIKLIKYPSRYRSRCGRWCTA